MNQLNSNNSVTPLLTASSGNMKAGEISHIEGDYFVIEGSLPAKQALSCLLKPKVGDQVMYWNNADERWILAVLATSDKNTDEEHLEVDQHQHRELSIPGNLGMQIQTRQLTVNAHRSIDLNTMGDINLNAVIGKLCLSAKSCVQTIQDSLIQMARHVINRADYIDHQAEKVLKSHASHQLITAEKDVKIDAERINMG